MSWAFSVSGVSNAGARCYFVVMAEPEGIRLKRARTFDGIAELYDRARSEPPDQLFEELFALAGIDPIGANILEIGCGTGQATVPLARRGCRVVAVEVGANLARIAKQKLAGFPRVSIVNSDFEEYEPTEVFDMVLAITSWHWLDPKVRYAKASAALGASGILAFTTGEHVFPSGFDPFFMEIQDCYRAIGVGRREWPPPRPEDVRDARAEIEQTGLFTDVRVARLLWTQEFSADAYVALMNTASDHQIMETSKRARLFAEMRRQINARPDARIVKHNLTILHVARKGP